jgi:hypothetical protein
MLRILAPFIVVAVAFSILSCADDTVVQTSSIKVEWDEEQIDVFTAAQTFSVVTADVVPPDSLPDLDDEEMAFNEMVNAIIIDAMQAEPVCLTFIDPEDLPEGTQPDLWAANGLSRTTDGGWYYECVGGWWWGYWGWYWDSCAYWRPTYVEWDVGSLLIPVGLPLADDAEPELIFAGLAQSVIGTGADTETKVQEAVRLIFDQWPVQRTCTPR